MKSFIKIYGPPINKAIKALEKIAIEFPEVCIMDTIIQTSPLGGRGERSIYDPEQLLNYFGSVAPITIERCNNIISKSGESLGEHDFFFEWFQEPSMEQLNELIGKIDSALSPLGCKYTITTK